MGMTENLHRAFARCGQQDKANAAEIAALRTALAGYYTELVRLTDRMTILETRLAELVSWAASELGYEESNNAGTSA